jgi:hypothetical protein
LCKVCRVLTCPSEFRFLINEWPCSNRIRHYNHTITVIGIERGFV